ncbi:MAG: sigma 54-interacting transcriptional regulator, partial [Caldisericaceae bacterium]
MVERVENLVKFVSPYELQKRKSDYFFYLIASKKHFEKFIYLNDSFTISFVDKDGVVLLAMNINRDPVIREGMIIDNLLRNTTALGMALEKIKEAEVKGYAFANFNLKDWSSAASPIVDRSGNLIGAVSISSPNRYYPKFALEITSLMAQAIQNEVNFKNLIQEINLSRKLIESIVEANKDGIIVLDKNAKVLFINSSGASILGVNKKEAINKNVTEIVDFKPVILNVYRTRKGYTNKEFVIESPSKGILRFTKTAVVLKDTDDDFAGVIDFFNKTEETKRFAVLDGDRENHFTFEDIISKSPKIKEAIRLAKLASQSNTPVHLTGETGTGKEMFAQAIHFESIRADKPFIAINCGAIPSSLAESELFGYEPGAFTDADKNGRPGKFELANGGTLFLDEIEELPLEIQVKLLRVLEDKIITRIGSTKSFKVDVRIISASNKKLDSLVKSGSFRADLFYRLNAFEITLPPLRERKEDIPLLVSHFIKKFAKEFNKSITGYDESFINPLLLYDFPGNVRELQNVVERSVNLASKEMLTKEYLPKHILEVNLKDNTANPEFDTIKKDYIEKILLECNYN